ncbi:MAG TPA: hypothetical protein VGM90_29905 [Kofleriaceae bacterium]
MRLLVAMVVLAGCGRLRFDSAADADPGSDAPDGNATCGGRDCEGGACVMDVCQPAVLVETTDLPVMMALDGDTLYWTGDLDTINGCSRSGCATPTVLASGEIGAHGIALDDTTIYWTNYQDSTPSGVRACSKTSCSPTTLQGGQIGPFELRISGNTLYWTDFNGGELHRHGTSPAGLDVVLATGVSTAWGLVVVNDIVYFTVNNGTGRVRSCPSGGCAAGGDPVALSQVNPNGITAANGSLYWTNVANGEVHTCVIGSCVDDNVIAYTSQPQQIVVDQANVYWTDPGTMSVYSCPLGGCPVSGPHLVADNQPDVSAIVVDETHLYWGRDGAVMLLVK